MRSLLGGLIALVLFTVLGDATSSAQQPSFAIVSIRDRTADPSITGDFGMSLETALLGLGPVIERETVRAALRQRRIRQIDGTDTAALARLSSDLAADWLVSITIHEARTIPVPTMTLSALAIRGSAPLDSRSGFVSATGIDGIHLLGLGEQWDTNELAATELEDLIDQLRLESTDNAHSSVAASAGSGWPNELGRIAILPLTSQTRVEASAAADAATRALYSVLQQKGAELVAPSQLAEVLRQQKARRWGEIDAAIRRAILEQCRARFILTGSVEAYDAGLGIEPRPFVAISLRGLDAAAGRIVWTGALERDGWFRQKPFRVGRINSRGELLITILDKLMSDLAEQATSLALDGAE